MDAREVKKEVLKCNEKMHDIYAPYHTQSVPYQCRKATRNYILKWRIQLASATPSKLNEKARWYSPLASPSNQRLRGVWAMHTLPGKNGTTSARQ